MGWCSVCSKRTTKVCSKCDEPNSESYFCANCKDSDKFRDHVKSHQAKTVGVRKNGFKGEIWITTLGGQNANVEKTLPYFAASLRNKLGDWLVYESLDGNRPKGLSQADVVLILYGMLGVRPSKPNWTELEQMMILESTNVVWVGVQYSADTKTMKTDLEFEDPTTGFGIGEDGAKQPYNFRIIADPRNQKVIEDAPQNISNISRFKTNLENYVALGSAQPFVPPPQTVPNKKPVVLQTPTTTPQSQQLQVQLAQIAQEEANLRAQIAELSAKNITQQQRIAQLEMENLKLKADHQRLKAEHDRIRQESLAALENVRRVLDK